MCFPHLFHAFPPSLSPHFFVATLALPVCGENTFPHFPPQYPINLQVGCFGCFPPSPLLSQLKSLLLLDGFLYQLGTPPAGELLSA